MATIVEVETEEISKKDVVAIISTKEKATILDHLIREEVEITLDLLAEEEDEQTITRREIISIADCRFRQMNQNYFNTQANVAEN